MRLLALVPVLAAAFAWWSAAPAWAGAPTVELVNPTVNGGTVGPTTDFEASAGDTGTGVGAVQFEYSDSVGGPWGTFATANAPGLGGYYHGIWSSPPPDGHYYVRVEAFDAQSAPPLSSVTNPAPVLLDSTPPSLAVTCTPQSGQGTPGACGWYTSTEGGILVCATADDGGGSGIASFVYTDDGTDPLTSGTAQSYDGCLGPYTADTTLRFAAVDAAGNTATTSDHVGFDDSAPPAPHFSLGPASSASAFLQQLAADSYRVWYQPDAGGTAQLQVPANDDPESGVRSVSFVQATDTGWQGGPDGGPPFLSATYEWQAGTTTGFNFTAASTNGAGQQGPSSSVAFAPDATPPAVSITCVPASCSSTTAPVQVTLHASDGDSGIGEVRYTTDGSDPANGEVASDGTTIPVTTTANVVLLAVDEVGNQNETSAPVSGTEARAGDYTVTTTTDSDDANPGDGVCADGGGACSLRAAVEESNADPAGSTITVPAGSYQLTAGALVVSSPMTITGAGARTTTVSQSGTDRVFDVTAGADPATISGFTLTGGTAGPSNHSFGGDVRNTGNLTLRDDTITDGSAQSGGGVSNAGGTLLIDRSTVSGNSAVSGGGDSGGVQNWGGVQDWAGNTVGHGALTIRNSTISGNTALLGGGVFSWNDPANTVVIESSTIAGNTGGDRGIGGLGVGDGGGTATVRDTIVAGNTVNGDASNCGAAGIQSLGHNLESGTDCGFTATGDLQGADPLLGALGDNGGPTDTLLPAAGSPAIDAADASCPPTDQRGISRPQRGVCDIGAVEVADAAQSGATYTVNTAADHDDGVCGTADCTLREAIDAANAGGVAATIQFAIGVGGVQTISPTTALPAVQVPVTIDGTSQPGVVAGPGIVLDGTEIDGLADGLLVEGSDSTVRGLDVVSFPGIGIHVLGGSGTVVAGNVSGIALDGSTPAGNGRDGIQVEDAANVTVGGAEPADRNVVGGNSGHGIFLAGATGSTVQGNYSGLDVAGDAAIPNGLDGVAVDGGSGNTIAGNVSSGNSHQGVALFDVDVGPTSRDVVRGNKVGTDASGDGTIPNGGDGILVADGTGQVVGGAASGQGNLVRGNHKNGVRVTNASGAAVLGNTIVDNDEAGVRIDADAPNTTVGGTDPGDGNTITGNGGPGVSVASAGNSILGNSIDSNEGGIDLGTSGNQLQAAPLIAAARSVGSTLTVVGKFITAVPGTYRLEYFLSTSCDGAEGATFLGSSSVDVNAGLEAAVHARLQVPVPLPGTALTATATSPTGNTSSFSRCIEVAAGGTATSATLNVSTDTRTTPPGAFAVPLADIPPSAFGKVTYDSNGNPLPPPIGLGSIGLGSIGLGSIGLGSIGLGSIGLGSIDLASSGLGSIGLGSIGFNDATLLENGLGGIPLNTIPLKPPDSWEEKLQGTSLAGLPIQTLTIKDVLDKASSTLAGIGLGSIDLSHSGLGSIGLGSIGLGSIGLGSIPLDSDKGNSEAQNLALWCSFVHAVPGFSSYDCSQLAGQNVLGLALQGVPVASGLGSIGLGSIDLSGTGLGSIGLGSIDLADSGLGSIGLGSIGLGSIGLGSIGLGSIDLAQTGLGSIGLGSIDLASSGLGSIGLGSIGLGSIAGVLDSVVDCTVVGVDCSGTSTMTLLQAALAGALQPGATLLDLAPYFQAHPDAVTLAELGSYGNVTLGDLASYFAAHPDEFTLADLIPGLPPTATVDDLLSALLGGTPTDWEDTPLEGLAAFAGAVGAGGGLVTYSAGFTIQGQGTAVATLTVTPPVGAYYVPGSAQLSSAGGETTLGDPVRGDTGTLSWTLDSLDYDTDYTLTFQLRPGQQLGPEQASVTLATNGVADVSRAASVTVVDNLEPNDQATANAKAIDPATLYLSYLGNGKDVDYYTLHVDGSTAPAGTRIKVFLSHLHSDDDLAVYGPGEPALRGSGLGSIGLGSIGLGSIAPGEQPVEPGEENQSLQSDPAQDLPATALPAGDQLLGVSNNRGSETEEVDLTSSGQTQDLLLQVSSYDGHPTSDPYLLRVEEDKPLGLPPCGESAPPATSLTPQATLPTNASITPGDQTLILFDETRFAQYYGAADAQAVYAKLVQYAGQSSVDGVIVPVEKDSNVAAAYASWDTSLCSPAAANGVVKAIGNLLDSLQAGHPNLQSIVIVGADNVIPFARLLDQTQQANEVGFRSNFGYVNNQYVGAVAAGYLFSDDPYGDPAPRPFAGGFLYTPQFALGRLVETPSDIEKQLDAYDAAGGVIDPTTKLVSGYDFLTDGAQAVDKALPGSDTATDLINDDWNADALQKDMFPTSGQAPTIDSLNAHYDQHQALSAAGNTAHDESLPNLFTTSQIPTDSVVGRLVFTMGCHAGFSLFDGFDYSPAGNPDGFTLDWPQAYLANGAIGFMGNTGYGLGDTDTVAYSERLDQLFAQRLTTMTVGQALEYAKQEYFGDLGVVGYYDQKVANEATFYGLPTYRLGTGTPPGPPATLPTRTDAITGLQSADFSLSPTFAPSPDGSYYAANDPNGLGYQVVNRRPIEPLTSLDVTEPGTTAHGVLITSLASTDHSDFKAAFGRVTVDDSAIEPQLTGVTDFPAQIQSLVDVATPNGPRQRAMFLAGHFASGDGAGDVGTQRNYTSIGGTVLYSNSPDFVKPTITNMQVAQANGIVGFAADVSDLDQNGNPGTVEEALVLYLDASGSWRSVDLSCDNGRCTGGGSVTGTTIDYIAEAVDAAGNVGVNANKAAAREVAPASGASSSSGDISISYSASTSPNGWFTGPVTATLATDEPDATLSTSLDGAPFQPGDTISISSDGIHTIDARDSAGNTATFVVPIWNLTVCAASSGHGAKDVIVRAGTTCTLPAGTQVKHDVAVEPGGTLVDRGAVIGHDLTVDRGAAIVATGGSVGHDLTITGLGASGFAGNQVSGVTVGHDLEVAKNTAPIAVTSNSAGHDVVVTKNTQATVVSGNTAGHDVSVTKNQPGGVTVSSNSANHDAVCTGNNPQSGSGNTAGHANSCP